MPRLNLLPPRGAGPCSSASALVSPRCRCTQCTASTTGALGTPPGARRLPRLDEPTTQPTRSRPQIRLPCSARSRHTETLPAARNRSGWSWSTPIACALLSEGWRPADVVTPKDSTSWWSGIRGETSKPTTGRTIFLRHAGTDPCQPGGGDGEYEYETRSGSRSTVAAARSGRTAPIHDRTQWDWSRHPRWAAADRRRARCAGPGARGRRPVR